MDNQKGSIKDRLRARMLYLEYKKNKRKKEKELEKKKKEEKEARIRAEHIRIYGKPYSKKRVFLMTILGLLVGIITPKGYKKNIESELELIEREKKQIFLHLENDKDIKEIYHRVDDTYQKLEDLKHKYKNQLTINSFNPLDNNKILTKIDEKQRELVVINEICHSKEKNINKTNGISEVNNNNNKENNPVQINQKVVIDIKENQDEIFNTKESLLNNIKIMNLDIKEYSKQLELIERKVTEEELYSTLFEYEFKLKQLDIRLKKILEEYELLKEQYSLEELNDIIDIDVFDKYELRKDEKIILKKIEECNILFNKIEEKKGLLSSKKLDNINKEQEVKDNEKQTKKLVKNKNKEEDKKELKEQFDDIYLANKIIINNIIEEKKMLDKLKRKLSSQTSIVKKKTVFVYAKRFTNSILTFGISLIPIKYFRNRLLGSLVSGIMLNNSLRTTRKILTFESFNEDYILYNNILSEINSNEDYISKLYTTCLDSQFQIQSIKQHLNANFSMMREYDSELLQFYNQLDSLNNELERQLDNIHKMQLSYSDIKRKVKIKNPKK